MTKKNNPPWQIDLVMELLIDTKKIYNVKPNFVVILFYLAAKLMILIRTFFWQGIVIMKSNRLVNDTQMEEFFGSRYLYRIGELSENTKAIVVKE